MLIPTRSFAQQQGDAAYRYGFNGMENDDKISGEGNAYTTEYRGYDSRLGRWKSLDPLMNQFPDQSPYNFVFNNPINLTDIYGDCPDDTDCETLGSKSEKTANNIINRNGGSASGIGANLESGRLQLTDEENKMLFRYDSDGNILAFSPMGKLVNSIIIDQAYLEARQKEAADLFSELMNSELTNAEFAVLSEFRAEIVNQTKAKYMMAIFSPNNVGTMLFLGMASPVLNTTSKFGSSQSWLNTMNRLARDGHKKFITPYSNSLDDFGQNVMKWGKTNKDVLNVANRTKYVANNSLKVASELHKQGVTGQMVKYWRDFYAKAVSNGKGGEMAKERLKLMQEYVKILNK
jgi:RHS repeat-associated protein